MRDVDTVVAESAALAAAARVDHTASVGCYDGWSIADLARHVGQIQRWITGVVLTRASERPSSGEQPTVPDADVADWLEDGSADLADALRGLGPEEPVWTLVEDWRTGDFWHRRMALEATLHRWDAEDALGRDPEVAPDRALQGVDEALHVYLLERLPGSDVSGSGQRVGIVPAGDRGWTMVLHEAGIEVVGGVADVAARLRGSALDLWLLLTRRAGIEDVDVEGDPGAAALAARAATLLPGPAG